MGPMGAQGISQAAGSHMSYRQHVLGSKATFQCWSTVGALSFGEFMCQTCPLLSPRLSFPPGFTFPYSRVAPPVRKTLKIKTFILRFLTHHHIFRDSG